MNIILIRTNQLINNIRCYSIKSNIIYQSNKVKGNNIDKVETITTTPSPILVALISKSSYHSPSIKEDIDSKIYRSNVSDNLSDNLKNFYNNIYKNRC